MHTFKKISDEGTKEPFVARLMFGVLTLSDTVIPGGTLTPDQLQDKRTKFHELYRPVLDAMSAMRKANKEIRSCVADHRNKIMSGEIIRWQPNSMSLLETIDSQLKDDFNSFLNNAIRAFKSVQEVTAHFGVKIGGIYAKPENFERHLKELQAAGHAQLADYLRESRQGWSERLIDRRNKMEHEGWALGGVQYPTKPNRTLEMFEPTIDSQNVTDWVDAQCRHVIAFVEEVVIYTFQRVLPSYMSIVEIPVPERETANPGRFRVGLIGIPQFEAAIPWTLRYDSNGFQ